MERLKDFTMRHPYLPLVAMAALDIAGYLMEAPSVESRDVGTWTDRLHAAFTEPLVFVGFFPEEIFVAITAYGLSRKMRTFKEETEEVEDIVAKVTETGRAMTNIWSNRKPPRPADKTAILRLSD